MVERLSPPPWSRDTQALIDQYASPDPERERRAQELGLSALQSSFAIVAGLLWVGAAAATDGDGSVHRAVFQVGWGILCSFVFAAFLHGVRFYDSSLVVFRTRHQDVQRTREVRPYRWPRSSSDLDFVLQLGVAITVGALS
jgi:hypothetical protein